MGRKSPGVGHNSDGALQSKPARIRHHLAIKVLDQEEMDKLRERIKAHSKAAQGDHIPAEDLTRLFKMMGMTATEVEIWMRRQWHVFAAFFTDLGDQFDIFAPKPAASEVRAAYRHHGMMAGIKGEACEPPPTLAGDERQQWIEGHHEGTTARDGAEKTRMEEIVKALDNADKGVVTDGTTKPKRQSKADKEAEALRAQQAADFKADNPDVKIPDGVQLPGTVPGSTNTSKPQSQSEKAAAAREEAARLAKAAKDAKTGGEKPH